MKLATMTVGELKAALDDMDGSMPVMFSYPSGDHWHTVLLGTIDEIEVGRTEYTEYHRCFKVVSDDDRKGKEVVILR